MRQVTVTIDVAETTEDVRTLPLGWKILTRTDKVLIHEETGSGSRYWIEDGTLEPLQPSASWLPAIILPRSRTGEGAEVT